MVDINAITTKAMDLLVQYGPKVLLAIITLIIGLWIIKIVAKAFKKVLGKRKIDKSLESFLVSLVSIILKVLLFISVIGMLGVETTSFVAILAAAGFAIGLALQGSLGNFAGGVLILLFKPFKVGDFIEAQGESGSVKQIQIFNTILTTGDNKRVIIPNGPLSNGNITNYSTEDTRRVDMVFGIGYDDDIKKAKTILEKMVKADSRVLKDKANLVAVGELADSSVNFKVRVWVNSSDYWSVFHDFQENVKLTFDKEGLSIPFPQMDIHQHK